MPDIKFIADLHIYDLYSRDWRFDYPDVDMYANHLIGSWNSFTDPDDTVIIAGDIGHYCHKTIEVLRNLNGNLILVVGNHDLTWGKNLYTCGVFKGVHNFIQLDNVYIQHIPDETTLKTTFYIHGHHHTYETPGMQRALKQYARDTYRLNCAADLIEHRPRTLQELILSKELLIDRMQKKGLI